ncbi:hypothetical protein C8Q76DRAFT_732573 [Earliella scabrosa]|nr:hypothetical protein C8Q76DRAFT_732573 [Earliella scabrosa]
MSTHVPRLYLTLLLLSLFSQTISARRGPITWFFIDEDDGRNHCGSFDGDNAVLLSSDQWDNGAHCFKFISISFQRFTVTAQVNGEVRVRCLFSTPASDRVWLITILCNDGNLNGRTVPVL